MIRVVGWVPFSVHCWVGVGNLAMLATHSAMSTLSDSTSFVHGWFWKREDFGICYKRERKNWPNAPV